MRAATSGALLVVASLLLAAGIAALYVEFTVLDENRFAHTTARALHEPAVRREVGRALGVAVVRADTDLIAARAGIEAATETLLETRLLDPVVREAAVELHRTLLGRNPDDALFDLGDARALVSSFVDQRFGIHLPLAGSTPAPIFGIDADSLAARATRAAHDVRLAIWLAPLALLLLVLAVLVAPERRRTLPHAGLAVAVSGLLLLVVDAAVRHIGPKQFAEREAVAQALGVFLGPFFWWAIALLGIGAVVALATSRFADLPDADRLVVVVAHAVTRAPTRRSWKIVHALAGVLLGLTLLLAPLEVLKVAGVALGFLLVVDGLVELARLAGGYAAADPALRQRTHRRWLAAAGARGAAGADPAGRLARSHPTELPRRRRAGMQRRTRALPATARSRCLPRGAQCDVVGERELHGSQPAADDRPAAGRRHPRPADRQQGRARDEPAVARLDRPRGQGAEGGTGRPRAEPNGGPRGPAAA